ncbi:HlyD family efflux transporter periplasmic adaptor subunit [Trinickia sp. YCB016]
MKLFRTEALDAIATKWLGEIVLVRPVSFGVFAAIAGISACSVMAFLYFGHYTRRSTVSGQLLPESGIIKVYAPQSGIVLEKHVAEGEFVKKGALIYVLSSDHQDASGLAAQAEISVQVQRRINALENEKEKTEALQRGDRRALVNKVTSLQTELVEIEAEIASQKARTELAQDAVRRYESLASQDYISRDQAQQQQATLIDQQMKLQGLERDRASAAQALAQSRGELSELTPKQTNEMSQLERTLSSTREEFAQSEAKREVRVVAPEAGIATGQLAEAGQSVDGSRPLLNIVPATANLNAQLYAPSGAIGFIGIGDDVLLRYQAYPYQKFGEYRGRVATVARTALPSSDLLPSGSPISSSGGSYYLITVRLERQTVHAYGAEQPLQSGMALEADIFQERRRLYEWALAPLYSLTGKLGR